jgi:hypothetical protein
MPGFNLAIEIFVGLSTRCSVQVRKLGYSYEIW